MSVTLNPENTINNGCKIEFSPCNENIKIEIFDENKKSLYVFIERLDLWDCIHLLDKYN